MAKNFGGCGRTSVMDLVRAGLSLATSGMDTQKFYDQVAAAEKLQGQPGQPDAGNSVAFSLELARRMAERKPEAPEAKQMNVMPVPN